MSNKEMRKPASPFGPGPGTAPVKDCFGRLFRFMLEDYRWHLLLVAVCVIVGSVASVVITVIMQRLIDDCIMPGLAHGMDAVAGTLLTVLVTLAAVYLVSLVSSYLYTRVMAVVTQGVLKKFRDRMFNHMQTLPIGYFDRNTRGEVMSAYTNDTDATRQLIGQSLPMLLQCGLSAVSIFLTMLGYSIWLTLVVCLMLAVMLWATKFYGGTSSHYMMAQQKSLAREEGYVEEILQGQKVVQVFCREEECKREFDELNEQLFHDSKTANHYGNLLLPVLGNLSNIMYVLLAFVGGLMVFYGAKNWSLAGFGGITVGVLVSFLAMSRQITQTVGQISMQIPMIAMGLAGAQRIFALLDEKPEQDEGHIHLVQVTEQPDGSLQESEERSQRWAWKEVLPDGEETLTPLQGSIRMEQVDFSYIPGKQVLSDVSLWAEPGQKIAFVGATGAGKTTITNLINRFYDIDSGTIHYDGIDIQEICKPDLRRSLGIVLQDVNLFTGTVLENIRYGRLDATDQECIEAAKLANADDFITRLPEGYQTLLSGNGASLSQGQRQLISIARAAVADPPVMILDEATSSIDTRTEALVQSGMDNLMQGRTVFVIAHRLSTVRNSDVILVLDHGCIIERGSHEELLEQKRTYYQLYTGAFELE